MFLHAPTLRIDYPKKDFVVFTNACKEGLSAVLMQEEHVIFYESRKLNEHVKNYATHDLELVVIVH